MSISNERLTEIKNFQNTDFSDCPVLKEEQLSQLKPCHLINRATWKPQKKALNIRIDADLLETLRASGRGWQTRLNAWIREGVATNRL